MSSIQQFRKPIFVFQTKIEKDKVLATISDSIDKGWIGLGKVTEAFEREFAEYVGAKYAVGLNSATAGLHLALILAGVKKHQQVITTPMTFVSTNAAILYVDANPFFVDVGEYLHIKIDDILNPEISPNSAKAIMLVHFGGIPIEKKKIIQLQNNCPHTAIIQDCAHATGAKFEDGSMVGSFGDYNIFSFHAVKNLPSPDGGMLVTNDASIAAEAKKLRWMGIDKDTASRTHHLHNVGYSWYYNVGKLGYKYHMNDITAAFGLAGLDTINRDNDRRGEIRQAYYDKIDKNYAKLVMADTNVKSANHMATLILRQGIDRNTLIQRLKDNWNIHPGVHYTPNNYFEPFSNYPGGTIMAWNVYKQIVTLPCHLEMTDEDVARVITAVNSEIDRILEKSLQ